MVECRGGKTPHQGIRCLLPPDEIFSAAKCGVVKSESGDEAGAEMPTAARMGGGLKSIWW